MNKYDIEYNRLMRKMEKGGSLDNYTFKIDTPSGIPTKLTYIQQVLVRTTNFKNWFGDWERAGKMYVDSGKHANVLNLFAVQREILQDIYKNEFDESIHDLDNTLIDFPFICFSYEDDIYLVYKEVSKAIDAETLEPRVVYHGTKAESEFYDFKTDGSTGRPYAYFAYNREYSEHFRGEFLYDCFLNVRDPYWDIGFSQKSKASLNNHINFIKEFFYKKAGNLNVPISDTSEKITSLMDYQEYALDKFEWASDSTPVPFWYLLGTDYRKKLKKSLELNGFDGAMFGETISLENKSIDILKKEFFTRAIVIFEPNQVKLADGRNVDFFGNTPDIRYDYGGRIQNTLYDVLKNYTDLSGKQYFYKDGVFVRIKDHLAKWSNFESYNMDLDGVKDYYILSIVIADDPNNALLRESDTRVEKFINDNEDDFDDLIAREYIYSPNTSAESIISDIDYYISKMSQGKRNFANGGALQNKEIMLPDTTAKYAHLRNVLKQQGFDIYPTMNNMKVETYEVGGTIKHEKGATNDGKKGGYFEGRSHADGGIKAFNVSTQTPIEVEGGEVIITKKAVDDDDLKEFEGEMLTNREILSRINQSGGGVAFEEGGEIHSCNCSGSKFAYGGETIEDYEIIRRLQNSYDKKQNMKEQKTQYGHSLMRKMKQGGFI